MANGESGEVVVRMVLDASDLDQVMGGRPGALAGGSGGGGGGQHGKTPNELAGVSPSMGVPVHIKTFAPTFMSIFKPLAALEAIKSVLGIMVRNSTVLNQYQQAMGKVFGAAIDILLLPFMPLLNLIMAGVMALMAWLMKIGAMEWLQQRVKDVIDWLKALWEHLKKIWVDIKALKDDFFNPGKWGVLFQDLAKLVLDPRSWGAIATLIFTPIVLAIAAKAATGGILSLVGKALTGAGGVIIGAGSVATAAAVTGAVAVGAGIGTAGVKGETEIYKAITGHAPTRGPVGGWLSEHLPGMGGWYNLTGFQKNPVAGQGGQGAGAPTNQSQQPSSMMSVGTQNNTFNIQGVDAKRASEMTLEQLQKLAFAAQAP